MQSIDWLNKTADWAGSLKGSELRVAVILAKLQIESGDGFARIAWTDLEKATGLTWRSIDVALQQFKQMGLLVSSQRGSRHHPAIYRLNLDWSPDAVKEIELLAA